MKILVLFLVTNFRLIDLVLLTVQLSLTGKLSQIGNFEPCILGKKKDTFCHWERLLKPESVLNSEKKKKKSLNSANLIVYSVHLNHYTVSQFSV